MLLDADVTFQNVSHNVNTENTQEQSLSMNIWTIYIYMYI